MVVSIIQSLTIFQKSRKRVSGVLEAANKNRRRRSKECLKIRRKIEKFLIKIHLMSPKLKMTYALNNQVSK